ncbi:3-phosphoserine/phosphohydroxythreonine transaminase [Aliikangiella maris]|uniref:Phosphoserine aminotransferase n=2 Tax=Aliikangiella maris TaxID=3162458 RepID=A0ABV2BP60_9GAMM
MNNHSVFNFCAGPAALPKPVMQQAQAEFLDWRGLGVSVMEVSHRSSEYQELANKAESDFRELLKISDDYAVLFMHGGATHQFSNLPMCLLSDGQEAEYIVNGVWSSKAAVEATRYGQVNRIDALFKQGSSFSLIDSSDWQRSQSPIYTHYTQNETIEGLRFPQAVKSNGAVVADMSSSILSEVLNIDDYDFIYAGAQKNVGPAGMTIVIVKRQLVEQMDFTRIPRVFNYQLQIEQGSMLNTPPTYTWYLAALVFEWVIANGGVEAMEHSAIEKSQLLYECIDMDDFYTNPVEIQYRSRMNIPFILADSKLNETFLSKAKKAGLIGLKGHRSVGGMRASLYNSMPVDGVKALVDFMLHFKQQNG